MKFIEDIKEGDIVTGHYFCKEKQTLRSRAGKTYLSILLSDKTGVIDGKVWEINSNIQNFDAGDFIKVEGSASNFNGDLQLKITKLRPSAEGEYVQSDYIPVSGLDVDAQFQAFYGFVDTIGNTFIKTLLENIFGDPEMAERFKESTAAKTLHHNYMGGLLEHTLSVVKLCDGMSGHYPFINRDILIAAAMLHDIGKVWELTTFPENDYTDVGQLLGHIYLGTELILEETSKIQDFPENLTLLLKHCILSHHGDYEFGSPRLPSVIEAFVLFACDNLDAKVYSFMDTINRDKSNNKWTGYNKMLARNIRRTQ